MFVILFPFDGIQCEIITSVFCDTRHKLAEKAFIAVFGLLPKRNFLLKSSLIQAFLEEVPCLVYLEVILGHITDQYIDRAYA